MTMFQRVRKHLTPATVMAFIALVFAITGGAFAATGSGSGSGAKASASVSHSTATAAKSKAKPKAKTGPRGPAGPVGKSGTNGTNGTPGAKGETGPAGTTGAKGETGTPGTPGTDGTDGTSVTTSGASSGECPSGGIKVTASNGSKPVCNGTTGFTKTLPEGETETGAWAVPFTVAGQTHVQTAISFAIPLAAAIEEHVHYVNGKEEEFDEASGAFVTPTHCLGSPTAPTAPRGELCVYEAENEAALEPGIAFADQVITSVSETGGRAGAQRNWRVAEFHCDK